MLSDYVKQAKRHYKYVVAFVVVVGLIIIFSFVPDIYESIVKSGPESALSEDTGSKSDYVDLEPSLPILLRIPSIGVEADFEEPLGLKADQTIEVPDEYDTVGWYKYGPTPGELGPAVVLGHVDSYEGPAVLFGLGQLKEGDELYIDREDGTTVTFKVTKLERHLQSGFPTAEVYGDIDHAGLRIITCSGIYDRGSLRYSHNLIVFAEMVQ